MKCLIRGCLNEEHQGRFIGELCAPCHEMLATGTIQSGDTWIHKMQFDLLNRIYQLTKETT